MIAGVILAGGRATRMGGGDKALLPLGGRPILARVIERLRPQVDRLALNANGDPARFADFALPVLPDSVRGLSRAAGRGARRASTGPPPRGSTAIVTAACDTPFFPRRPRREADAPPPAAGSPSPRRRGRAACSATRRSASGRRRCARISGRRSPPGRAGCVDWAESHGGACAVFAEAGEPFFNVNTPEDLVRAEALLAAGGR